MRTKIRIAILITGSLFLNSSVFAASMRLADGKPCYPTEKTIFGKDGVTPFSCIPAGGPAYSFKVYVREHLLWSGKLASTEPEVFFELPTTTKTEKNRLPHLIIKRDLERDPTGNIIFFGESSLGAMKSYTADGNSLQLGEMQLKGVTFASPSPKQEKAVHVGKISGAVFDQIDYRVVIQSK